MYIYIYIYIYMHISKPPCGPSAPCRQASEALLAAVGFSTNREFTKGGLVKGGLAIQVLLLYYYYYYC